VEFGNWQVFSAGSLLSRSPREVGEMNCNYRNRHFQAARSAVGIAAAG
jgi:hypothetical protein